MVCVRLPQLIFRLKSGSVLSAGMTLCCRGSPAELWAEEEKAQCKALNWRRACVSRRIVLAPSLPPCPSPPPPPSLSHSYLHLFVYEHQALHRLSPALFLQNFIALGRESLSTDSFSTRWHVVFTIRRCVARPCTVIRAVLSCD